MRLDRWESPDPLDLPEFPETLEDLEKVERRDQLDLLVHREDLACLDLLAYLDFLVREACLASLACLD